jgi:TRAP-type C4-dicarboxylate transport system permease small subunit
MPPRLFPVHLEADLMDKILRATEKFNQICVWACGVVLFGTAFLIAVEVVLRKFFALSMGGADEVSGYALATICTWAFGFTLFRKGHVRVDVLYIQLTKKARSLLDILSLVMFLIYMSMLTYYAFTVLKRTVVKHSTANTPLQTPLWIPQGIWFFGLVNFTLVVLLVLIGTIYYLARQDSAAAQQLAGSTSLEEEIEVERGALSSSKRGDA